MNKHLKENEFYDINKFPSSKGICVYGISMPLIDKSHSPKKVFDAANSMISKIKKTGVGDVIVYSDSLYFNSSKDAFDLKKKFQKQIEDHKSGYLKLVDKDIFLVTSAFSFVTWSQLMLDCPKFNFYFEKLVKIYEKDENFKKIVKEDILRAKKKVDKFSINYILEEVLLDYLVAKGKARLRNDFVLDKEKWILHCYLGKPHKSHTYLFKNNLLKIKSDNCYEHTWYDLKEKKLYDFDRMNIETFDFS
ncbi:MAG: hypothetical protein ACMXX6_02015 [Candidatus Woesearchaeota archaeon]